MTEKLRSDRTYLTNKSEKDKAFDTHKANSQRIATLFGLDGSLGLKGFMHGSRLVSFDQYESRINECGAWLKYWETPNDFRLIDARFCKVPYCPMCQFRRSLKWRAKFLAALPEIQEMYPTHKWVFLTLTVKNCQIDELRANIKDMGKAWARLTKLVDFPLEGCIKSLEVTRIWDWYDQSGKFLGRHGVKWFDRHKDQDKQHWTAKPTDEVHPHFHILGLVPASYFTGRGYMKQETWAEMWKKSLRVSYDPIIHIERVKDKKGTEDSLETAQSLESQSVKINKGILKGICETLKYTVKEQDLIGSFCKDDNVNSDWLKLLTEQLYLLRRVEYKGVLKQFGKDVEKSMDNLIDIDENKEEEATEEGKEVIAYWMSEISRYVISSDS
jgi:plasmid rolling circle replication initiator protein Rep